MDSFQLIARLLMGILFIMSGFSKLSSVAATQAYMEAYGVPGYLIYPAAAFEISGAIMLFLHHQLRELAILLAGWCLLTATIFHTDFGDQNQFIHLMKNLTMAGGFLVLSGRGSASSSTRVSKNKNTVLRLLANASDLKVARELVAQDATYVSLNFSNADLQRIEPWCGTHEKAGPAAINNTFIHVGNLWRIEKFETQTVVAEGDTVAVFGQFRYISKTVGKVASSPFAVLAKLDSASGKIVYMQFMEDTFCTAASFAKEGSIVYESSQGKHVTIAAEAKS